jgi:hypothetical protein
MQNLQATDQIHKQDQQSWLIIIFQRKSYKPVIHTPVPTNINTYDTSTITYEEPT